MELRFLHHAGPSDGPALARHAARDREAFCLAEALGFTEAYVGEHVTDAVENITSSIVFLASLADRITRMRLGTGTVNLPNMHPAQVASQIAMLDHLLEGRLNFGIKPRRPFVRCRAVRQSRCRSQRHVRRGDRYDPQDMG